MATKKNMRISYPSSEKIYVPGEINKIKVGMRKIKLLDTVTLDEQEEQSGNRLRYERPVFRPQDID